MNSPESEPAQSSTLFNGIKRYRPLQLITAGLAGAAIALGVSNGLRDEPIESAGPQPTPPTRTIPQTAKSIIGEIKKGPYQNILLGLYRCRELDGVLDEPEDFIPVYTDVDGIPHELLAIYPDGKRYLSLYESMAAFPKKPEQTEFYGFFNDERYKLSANFIPQPTLEVNDPNKQYEIRLKIPKDINIPQTCDR